jgi:putative transposase
MPSTYTNLLYHVVFSTKCRSPLITNKFQDELYHYIGGIIRKESGVLLEIGGINDHIHLLIKLKSAVSVADVICRIKANSSKWANDNKMELRKFGWQEGYSAFSVSESQVPTIRKYIQDQEKHHQKQSYQQEYIALLNRNRIQYDEQYLWE